MSLVNFTPLSYQTKSDNKAQDDYTQFLQRGESNNTGDSQKNGIFWENFEIFLNNPIFNLTNTNGDGPDPDLIDLIKSIFPQKTEFPPKTKSPLTTAFCEIDNDGDLSDEEYEKYAEEYEAWAKKQAEEGILVSATLIDAKANKDSEIYKFCMDNEYTNDIRRKIWEKTPIKDTPENVSPQYAVATAIDNAELNGEVSADEVDIIKRVLVAICKEDSDKITEDDITAFATRHKLTDDQTDKLKAILDEVSAVGVNVELTAEDKDNKWYTQFAIDSAKTGDEEQDKSEKNIIERLLDVTGKPSVLDITAEDLEKFAQSRKLTDEQTTKLKDIVEDEQNRIKTAFDKYLTEANSDDCETSESEEEFIRLVLELLGKTNVKELNNHDLKDIQEKLGLTKDAIDTLTKIVITNWLSESPVSIDDDSDQGPELKGVFDNDEDDSYDEAA